MRMLPVLLLAGALSTAMAAAPRPAGGPVQLPETAIQLDGQPPCARDRLLVRLREDALPSRLAADRAQLRDLPGLEAFAQARGLRTSRPLIESELDDVARQSGLARELVVELATGSDLERERQAWAARPEVEEVTFDWLKQILVIPTDQYFSGQWALRNTGQNPPGGTVDCDIDAELAWDVYTGSTGIKIAIIDTGVDLDHPDLQAKIIAGYDFVNNDNNANDDNMHGTACASLAAAITNNGTTGMAGVDWNARIMPIKVLDADGNGWDSDIIAGVNWARTNGAHVISMSLGGGSYSGTFNTAVNNAYNAGIPVVCAAGNENSSTISYPAAYTNSMAIGALSPCNQRKSPSSCDGEWWWGSNYGTGLDVMSPGVLLRSATINGYITDMNGTSGATPQVAGVAALMKGRNSALTAQQIYDIIDDTADDLGAAGWDSQTGWGRLNAHQAVLAANPNPCTGETVPPVITHTPLPNTTNNSTPYAVSATVTDNCTLASVTLRWQVNGGSWSSVAMTPSGSTYSGSIPAQPYNSTVHYQIVAVDAASNTTTGDWTFQVLDPCQSDVTGPAITLVTAIPNTYNQVGPYVGTVSITDPCGLNFQALTYTVNGGGSQVGTITPIGGNQFSVSIPGQAGPATIAWTVTAADASANFNVSSQTWSFQVLNPCDIETVPPVIVHTPLGDTTNNSTPYAVNATVTDNCTLASVTLRWQINGGTWSSVAMSHVGSAYTGSIPAQPYGSLVHYQIVAVDARSNQATADHTFSVVDPCQSDVTGPAITLVTAIPNTYNQVGPYVGTVSITDPCGLNFQALTYTVNGGGSQVGTITPIGGNQFSVSIPGQAYPATIAWTVTAADASANFNVSSQTWSFQVLNPCDIETVPPVIVHTPLGDTTNNSTPYVVNATVTDNCTLASVTLRWQINGGTWSSVAMGHVGSAYTGSIPAQSYGSLVHYQIVAVDARSNQATADHSFSVIDPCSLDAVDPVITHTPLGDTTNNATPYPVTATVTDNCTVASVTLRWQVNGGSWSSVAMELGEGDYMGEIPAQATGSVVHYQIVALDALGNDAVADHSFTITDPCATDAVAPTLAVVSPFVDTTDTTGPYAATFSAADPCGLAATLSYTVNGGPAQAGTVTALGGDLFLGEIPGQAAGSAIAWTFTATDNSPAHNQAAQGGSFLILSLPIEEAPVLSIVWSEPGVATLTWNAVANATHYLVYGAASPQGSWSLLQTTTAISVDVTILDNQVRVFRVVAAN